MRTKEEFVDGFVLTKDLYGPYEPLKYFATFGEVISYIVKNRIHVVKASMTQLNCYIIIE